MTDPDNDTMEEEATRSWVEKAVLGLDLCPFARVPYQTGRVRITVSRAVDAEAVAEALIRELALLRDAPSREMETTLLVLPDAFADFDAFNDFLDVADDAVRAMELEGVVQVASFHPRYRFADSLEDDIGNFTNRSPYPTLHLLREESITAAVEACGDTRAIYERNIETMRQLGLAGWQALWKKSE